MRRVLAALGVVALVALAWWLLRAPGPSTSLTPSEPAGGVRRRPARVVPNLEPGVIHPGGLGGRVVDSKGNPLVSEVTLVRVVDQGSQTGDVVPCASQVERTAFDVARGRVTSDVVARVETAADGQFTFTSLRPGTYAVSALSPEGVSAAFPFEVGASKETVGELVVWPMRTLEVSVFPALQGASVLVHDATGVFAEVPFDASGHVSIPGLPKEGLGLVGVAGGRVTGPVDVVDGESHANLRFLTWHPLEVRVSRSGRRVSGVDVTVRSADTPTPCLATTDAEGVARFPSLASGLLTIEAVSNGASALAHLWDGWDGSAVDLQLDARSPLTLVAKGESGVPVVDAEVSIGPGTRGTTDANGELKLSTWRSGETIAVRHPRFEPAWVEIPYALDAAPRVEVVLLQYKPVTCRVEVPPGVDPKSVEVELPGTGIDVAAVSPGVHVVEDARRGTLRCAASAPGDWYGLSEEFQHPVTPEGSTVDVVLKREGGSITVHVVDTEGKAVAGLVVRASPDDDQFGEVVGARLRSGETDATGRITFGSMPGGTWSVRVFEGASEKESAESEVLSAEVELAAGASFVQEFVWPSFGTVEGVVVEAEGAPVSGAWVEDTSPGSRSVAKTAGNGRFSIRVPVDSALQLVASRGPRTSPPVKCRPGDDVELVLDPPALATGRILEADGDVPQGLRIGGRSVESPDGRFSVEVSPSEPSLSFTARDVPPLEVELPEQWPTGGLELGELRFPASRELLVHATTRDGQPLADVRVSHLGVERPGEWFTDATGVVVVDGVPPGPAKLRCERPDRSRADVDVPGGAREVTCVLQATGTLEVRLAPGLGGTKPVEIEVDALQGANRRAIAAENRMATFDLPAGRYVVTASDDDHEQLAPIRSVEVVAGGRVVVELSPFEPGGTVKVGRNEGGRAVFLLLGAEPPPPTLVELFGSPDRLRVEKSDAFENIPAGPAQLLACGPDEGRKSGTRARCRVVSFVAPGSGVHVVDIPESARTLVIELGNEF